MRILTGFQEAFDYIKPFLNSKRKGSTSARFPPQIRGPWKQDTTTAEHSLRYIFEKLHHNCYLLCSDGDKAEISKLESNSTAPSLRPYLTQRLNKTMRAEKKKRLMKTLRSKEWRIMQCILKPFKSSTNSQFPKFIKDIHVSKGAYIFSLTDAQILREDGREPWQMVSGSNLLGEYNFPNHLPMFAYSGQKGYYDIPIPTYDDMELYFKPYAPPNVDWESKKEVAVFRGSPTGCGYTVNTNMRLKLATMKSDTLDVGVVETRGVMRFDPVHGLDELNINIPKVSFMSLEEQAKHKYIIHVDGNVLAYRLLKMMLLGSVLLRVESPYVHWLDHRMKAGKHYISIKSDLSDLDEQIEWCKQNDKKCKKIAETAKKFAEEALSPEFMKSYFENLLNALKFS
jgi:hypothetical protein